MSSPIVDYDTITKRLERNLEIMSSIREGVAKALPSNELKDVRERLQYALQVGLMSKGTHFPESQTALFLLLRLRVFIWLYQSLDLSTICKLIPVVFA